MGPVSHDKTRRTSAVGLATGPRVLLRPLGRDDEQEFTRLVRASASLHHPWMSLPATPEEFQSMVLRFEHSAGVSLLVCERETGAILGMVNINNVVAGAFQCGALGYCAFAPAAGRGYMSEALRLVLDYSFGDLALHRLEANIQPANQASIRLVQRLGFRKEGFSPDFLFIDGAWRDHERWAITSEMYHR